MTYVARNAVLAAALLIAVSSAGAQTLDPLVQSKVTATTKRINNSALPQDLKDHFLGRIAKATEARLQVVSQEQGVDRVDADVLNTIKSYGEWDAFVKKITVANVNSPPRLRDEVLKRANDVRKNFPDHYVQVPGAIQRVQIELDNNNALLVAIHDFAKSVETNHIAPAILKAKTAERLHALIARLPGNVQHDWQSLQSEQSSFRNHMMVVAMFDSLQMRVGREVPGGYLTFKDNTIREIAKYRVDIGNPAGNVGVNNFDSLRRMYESRLDFVRTLAKIQAKIQTMPADRRAVYQPRHDKIAKGMMDYHGEGIDPDGLRRLADEVLYR